MDAHSSKSADTQPPTVHVSNLSYKTTVADLQALFSEVVSPVNIFLRLRSDNASAFAFATFASLEDCEKIIEAFNYHALNNKQMNIVLLDEHKRVSPEANIFVKNLPPNFNSKNLYEIFKVFGQVVSCKVASNANGDLKGYGFVQYRSPKIAKKVIASCQNVKINNYVLEVEAYNPELRDLKKSGSVRPAVFTNCYVKNFPKDITEDELRKVLEKYGKITSLFMPVKEDGTLSGFACANYENPDDARNAIDNLHGKHLFGAERASDSSSIVLPFYIQKAEARKDRVDPLHTRLENLSLDSRPKNSLYINNIPLTFSETEIHGIFQRFGTITDFQLNKPSADAIKQNGCVTYSTPEEAAVAFEKIDGTYLDGNRLHVSFYKQRSERIPGRWHGPSNGAPRTPNFLDKSDLNLDIPKKRMLNHLYVLILNSTEKYSGLWAKAGVENEAEFAQKMTLSMVKTPVNALRTLLHDEAALDGYIKSTIEKPAQKGDDHKSDHSKTSDQSGERVKQ